MTARLLDGRPVASRMWRELSERVAALGQASDQPPRLAILCFDQGGPSAIYAGSIARAARSVGLETLNVEPPAGVSLSDLAARIGALNRDPSVVGIVVAQPIPDHLDLAAVVELIDPGKDVDGATPLNAGRQARGAPTFVPATALGVMTLLRHYEIRIDGRRAVVVGRSPVVGRPTAELLLSAHASVMLTHRRTRNLARETRRAEILVVAAGSPQLIRPEMVNRSAVVIDCGINVTADGIVGDVDFDAVRPVVSAISPVPGGVGPVTTMCLVEQTVVAAEAAAQLTAGDESLARFASRSFDRSS
ncbi:MAG TPA: bifunctional 5,10-methylenetetrahydrofolate dehydrogenase/5,10-methenyltetrahydrofolate cyclohydrolase [Candidatus Limnocylindria bacterium]|nr:bifunctional 5,10-methylenetetrahydrofolate dehydrogenase/5,10-methenyltetrahydrofolate cyclohydrolase [Candidatus Limnocylindria bacterium]